MDKIDRNITQYNIHEKILLLKELVSDLDKRPRRTNGFKNPDDKL